MLFSRRHLNTGPRFSILQPGRIDPRRFGDFHDMAGLVAFPQFDFLDDALVRARQLTKLALSQTTVEANTANTLTGLFDALVGVVHGCYSEGCSWKHYMNCGLRG